MTGVCVWVVCGGCSAQVAMDDVERRKLPAFQWYHTVLISAKWSSNRYIIGQTQSCKHCFGCSQCKMPLAHHKEQVNAFLFLSHGFTQFQFLVFLWGVVAKKKNMECGRSYLLKSLIVVE